ncbi:hypothetical protein AtubIFM57143_005451 [Aspergillus tubingensis]|nr:hypothetical protein AtubIFM57143_005451 [Aspergillus tubingensis]
MAANSHLGGAGLPDVSQGPQILAATSITTAFALLTVLARMYVRVFFIRNVGPDLLKLSYTNTGLNILTDLIFAILPAIMLRHLQVNRRVKASLVCILGLGIFACAAAIVKLSVLPNYGRTGDLLWDYSTLTIWVVFVNLPTLITTQTNKSYDSVESNMGIIAGSLPTLKPLFKQFLGTYGSQTKTRRYTYGSKKYRLQSLSPSYPQPSVRSRPLSVLDPDDLDEGDPRAAQRNSKYGTTMTKYHYRDGSHTSEEYILTRQESAGIVLTTEVVVTHTTAEEVIRNNRGKRTQSPNEEV